MTQNCGIKHTPYYRIKYLKEISKLPYEDYLVCKSCYDSGMPWNNPEAIISKHIVDSQKFEV